MGEAVDEGSDPPPEEDLWFEPSDVDSPAFAAMREEPPEIPETRQETPSVKCQKSWEADSHVSVVEKTCFQRRAETDNVGQRLIRGSSTCQHLLASAQRLRQGSNTCLQHQPSPLRLQLQ